MNDTTIYFMSEAVRIQRVNPEDWPDFEALFESRGGPKNCWCVLWRPTSTPKAKMDKADRKAAMLTCVTSGGPVGLLAYVDNKPVAWCSVGPRPHFINLGGADDYPDLTRVWSLTCFFVKRPMRRSGLSDQLIQAALVYARDNEATHLEAYPVDPESPSYQFMGFVPQFEKHGFERIGQAGKRRHVYRLAL